MAAINDLIARIQDPELRMRIEKEVKDLTKQKKFGLVFENHIPEMTLLYDYPISRGCKVICKSDDDKKLSEDILWMVMKINKGKATCVHTVTNEEQTFDISGLICVAKNGEPIYPCLKFVDSVQNAPDSDLWHTLIEADNYHALQLLAYLYPGMVDCIYIDPPYNSGATDWKYNNNYVDGNDSYRHSKWLAMMESRLLLAKKLLNPEGSVLIVTIDEKEYIHLGCLLEELFPEAEGNKENNYKGRVSIQMISTVINPKGNRRNNEFSRCEEYLYFVFIGNSSITTIGNDMLRSQALAKNRPSLSVRWRALLRGASNHGRRRDRKDLFYPILFDADSGAFSGTGPILDINENRENYIAPEGLKAMWPIAQNGEELTWNLKPETLKKKWEKHILTFGKWDGEKRVGYYLSSGQEKLFDNGFYDIIGTDENGAYIIQKKADNQKDIRPLTIWNQTLHSASEYGTTFLNGILGSGRFSFPKSIYAVHDTLRFFVADKPDALILDFFAGSGTTLHAVNILNKEDGGHRRCIMVTNNEVSADEETTFRARGLHKGDEDWEKFGIARYVNWPRTKCSIEGIDVNGQPINGEYITSNTQEIMQKRVIKQLSFDIPVGRQGINVKKQIVALINDKNMPQNSVTDDCPYIVKEDAFTAILFDINSFDDFFKEIHEDIETIYVVSSNNKAFNAVKRELNELPERTKTVPVTFPMSDGFKANAVFYKLTFLDKEAVSLGTQLDKLLSILWMKAGAHGICPTHVEGEYAIFPENRMAILIDEYGFDELKEEIEQHPDIETVYIVDDSEDNYRALAAQLSVKNTYQLYRDYLDNFKINIESR